MTSAAPAVRQSASIAAVAIRLGVSADHVRRLIEAREIEAYRAGRRAVRVFLDSVAAWQARETFAGERRAPAPLRQIVRRAAGTAEEVKRARLQSRLLMLDHGTRDMLDIAPGLDFPALAHNRAAYVYAEPGRAPIDVSGALETTGEARSPDAGAG